MAEFQWWLAILGVVLGGTIVGLLLTNFPRGDSDLAADERDAEATFIANHLAATGAAVDRTTVARVLEAHREYLELPAPDAIVAGEPAVADMPAVAGSAADGDPDREPDDVGHAGSGRADRDLPGA